MKISASTRSPRTEYRHHMIVATATSIAGTTEGILEYTFHNN
jgi:hypothetical protein